MAATGRAEPLMGFCGSSVHVRAVVSCVGCQGPSEASWDLEPDCLLDNRADDLLALPLRPAADRPCGATLPGGSFNYRYGYDEAGRLQIVDSRLGDALQDRVVYTYTDAGTLASESVVAPTARQIYRRVRWQYDVDGVATGVRSDGWYDGSTRDPDGLPDRVDTLTLQGNTWRIARTTGPTVPEQQFTFDDANRSWTSLSLGMTTGTYAGAPPAPNAWVTLPRLELMWRVHALTWAGEVLTWSGSRLTSATSSSTTTTYLYACP